MMADNFAHRVRDINDKAVFARDHFFKVADQVCRTFILAEAMGKETKDTRIALQGLVSQGHEPVAYIANGKHLESPAQGGGTAA